MVEGLADTLGAGEVALIVGVADGSVKNWMKKKKKTFCQAEIKITEGEEEKKRSGGSERIKGELTRSTNTKC